MTESVRKRGVPAPAGNLSTGLLKLIALVFMFIDHSGKVLFNNCPEMRILGRIAFPVYVWCMIVGFSRTRSVPRYLLRIFLIGLISQPLYVFALDGEGDLGVILQRVVEPLAGGFSPEGVWLVFKALFLTRPNVFLTLLLGLAALWGIRSEKWLSQFWAPAVAMILASVLDADYGWEAVLLFVFLYMVQGSRGGIAAVMISFFLFWGARYRMTSSLFGLRIDLTKLPSFLSDPLSHVLRMETYALLSLPLILIRMPWRFRMPKWLSYGLYPAHLVVLIVLKLLVFGVKIS